MANYYKHRDEWPRVVWRDHEGPKVEQNHLAQARKTRRAAETLGVTELGRDSLRLAYRKLTSSTCLYSDVERKLGSKVQAWAMKVYKHAAAELSQERKRSK